METFTGRYRTLDGVPILVCGFCGRGKGEEAAGAFDALARTVFGGSTDGVVVDARLSALLRWAAPEGVSVLAASVLQRGCLEPCGGVLGRTDTEARSAAGVVFPLGRDIYGFALPGAVAAAIHGPEGVCVRLCEEAGRLFASLPVTEGQIRAYIERIKGFDGEALFVSDGSGGSAGCVYARGEAGASLLWIEERLRRAEIGEETG